ncbi:expressed unknown protein [Seminavis robusta]|uniref:Uncharacterized protein n=1 Tax=Seminavis robusta TaxID=568900 RepID=A0A9N8HQE5_9STRA|nr:expressed unknown protein [Seminavis robusta]|eukprot:Sro1186_g250350.1 n/a (106) ;mRNA; f:22182-22499
MPMPSPSGKDASIEATNTVDTAASTVGESPPTKSTSYKFETPAPIKQLFKNAGYSPPEDFETGRELPTPAAAQQVYEYYQVHSNSPAWGDVPATSKTCLAEHPGP